MDRIHNYEWWEEKKLDLPTSLIAPDFILDCIRQNFLKCAPAGVATNFIKNQKQIPE